MINLRYSTGGFASAIFNFKSYNKDNSITCLFSLPIDQEYARRFNTDLTCFKSGSRTDSFIAVSIAHKRKDLGIYVDHVILNNGNSEAVKKTWKMYTKGSHSGGKTWFKFAHKVDKEANHKIFGLHLFAHRNIPNIFKSQTGLWLYPDSKTDLTIKDTGVLLNPSLKTKTSLFEQITVKETVQSVNMKEGFFLNLSDSRGLSVLRGNSTILGLTKQSFDAFNNSTSELFLSEPYRETNLNDVDMRYSKRQLLNKNGEHKSLGIFTYDLSSDETLKFAFKKTERGFIIETDISIGKDKKDVRMADIYKSLALHKKNTSIDNTTKGMDYLDKQSKIIDTQGFLGYITDGAGMNDISLLLEEVTHHSKVIDMGVLVTKDNQQINKDNSSKDFDVLSKEIYFNETYKFATTTIDEVFYLGLKSMVNDNNGINFNNGEKTVYVPELEANYMDNKSVAKFNMGGSPDNGMLASALDYESSLYDLDKMGDTYIKELFKLDTNKFIFSNSNTVSKADDTLFFDKLHENKTVLNSMVSVIGEDDKAKYYNAISLSKGNDKVNISYNNKWLSIGSRDNLHIDNTMWFDKGNNELGLQNTVAWFSKSNDGVWKMDSMFADRINEDVVVYKNFTIAKVDNEGPTLDNSLFVERPQDTLFKHSTILGLSDFENSVSIFDLEKSAHRNNSNIDKSSVISATRTNTDLTKECTIKWIDNYNNGLTSHDNLGLSDTDCDVIRFDFDTFACRDNSDIAIHDTQTTIDLGNRQLTLGDVQLSLGKKYNVLAKEDNLLASRINYDISKLESYKMLTREDYNVNYDNSNKSLAIAYNFIDYADHKFLERMNDELSTSSQLLVSSDDKGLFKNSYSKMLGNNKYNLGLNDDHTLLDANRSDLAKFDIGYMLDSINTNLNVDNTSKTVYRNNKDLSVNASNILLNNNKYRLSNENTSYLLSNTDKTVSVNNTYKQLINTRNKVEVLKQFGVKIGSTNLGINGGSTNLIRDKYSINKGTEMIGLGNFNYDTFYEDSKFLDRDNDYISILSNTMASKGEDYASIEDMSTGGVNDDNEVKMNNMYLASSKDKTSFTAIGNKFLESDDKTSEINKSKFAFKDNSQVDMYESKGFLYKDANNLKKQNEDISLVNKGKSLGYSSFVFAESNKGDVDIFDTTKRIGGYAKYILKQDVEVSVSKSGNKTLINNGETTVSNSNKGVHQNNIGILLDSNGKEAKVNVSDVFVSNNNKKVFMEDSYKSLDSKDIGITVDDELSVLGGNSYAVIDNQLRVSKDGSTILIDNTDMSVGGGNSIISINQNFSVEFTNANASIIDSYKRVSSNAKYTSIDNDFFVGGGNSYTSIADSMFANYSNANAMLGNEVVRLDGYGKSSMINKYYLLNGYNKYVSEFDTDELVYHDPKYSTIQDLSMFTEKEGSSTWYENNKFISNAGKTSFIDDSNKYAKESGKTIDIQEGYLWYTNSGKYTDIANQIQFSNLGKQVFTDTVLKSLNFGGKALGIFNVKTASSHGKNLFTFGEDDLGVDDKVNKTTISDNKSLWNEGNSTDISDDTVTFDKLILLGEKVKMEYYGMTKTARATLFQGNMFGYVKDFLPPIEILKDNKDELLLPREQFDYTKYETKIFDENLCVNRKYIKGYTDEGDPIINIPIENPVTYYADIAKDYLDVDVTVMRKVLELLYNNWRKNIHRYAGVEATKAINNILEFTHNDLKEWYTSVTDPLRIKHAERSLRLFAWYSEMAILTHADYHISYERADAVFGFWDILPTYSFDPRDVVMAIKEDEILSFENFTYGNDRPYIVRSRVGLPATIKLRNVAQTCETRLTFSTFLFGKGRITVTTDDDIYVFDDRRGAIDVPLPASNNEVTINYSPLGEGSFVDISQFKIKNRYNTAYDLEYTGKVSNVNFTIQYILDVMTIAGDSVEEVQPVFKTTAPLAYALEQFKVYMETHHDKKYKGKRLTVRK